MNKIGFIGSGNMARAMIKGLILSGKVPKEDIFVSNINEQSLLEVENLFGVNTSNSNEFVAKNCDIIFLCTKPNKYEYVCKKINNYIDENKIIISIAPGQNINLVSNYFDKNVKVFSSMPNTPSKVLQGMSAICPPSNAEYEDINAVLELFKCFGEAEIVDESLMNAVIAVSGSSPAFIYILIEAMADSAVSMGLSRDKALKFAANAVLGSAKMVLEEPDHVAKLKDNVCSPGGTTIQGVLKLEETGFRSSIQKAMQEVYNKASKM